MNVHFTFWLCTLVILGTAFHTATNSTFRVHLGMTILAFMTYCTMMCGFLLIDLKRDGNEKRVNQR